MPSESNNPKDISFENPTRETLVKADQKPEEDGVAKCDIGAHEKALRKQNKVLPCPRCNSWETKFCYFNNYSVSQPRYFCKNCQRYWTAGGTIRKIPVGAGRRKNKHSSSVTLPDVVSETCSDALNLINNQRRSYTGLPASSVVRGNEEVLELSKDAPQCESMQNVLNLKDQDSSVEILSSATGDDNEEPMSTISSSAAATSQVSGFPKMEIKQVAPPGHCNCFNPVHTLQNYPVSQCPCHWNSAWNAVVFGPCSGISNTAHIGSPPMVHFNGFGAPSITFPFLPSSYWGCLPTWDNMKWNEPQAGFSSGSSASALASTGNGSLALGKHSREANSQPEVTKEQCLWVPKTLRIDDPEEAAKSSIWSTLGIRFDKEKPSIRDGIFKAFQPKSDSNSHTSDVDQILKANPAAFSRCQSFQEGN